MNSDARNRLLQTLEVTLDAYGADRARWPEDRRRELAGLIVADPQAREMLRETVAFDRLLDQTSDAARDEVPLALMSRIMSAAQAEGGVAPGVGETDAGNNVIPLPRRGVKDAKSKPAAAEAVRGLSTWREWSAAGMLAASLLLGVYIGGSGLLNTAVNDLTNVAGMSSSFDATSVLLPGLDTDDATTEDLL